MSKLKLFVYGSLKRYEFNWHVIADGVKSCRPAWLTGSMFLRHDGYPALVTQENEPRLGSREYAADLALSLSAAGTADGPRVYGELLELNPGALWIERLDQFEGYFPGAPSEYLRMLVAVRVEEGWESAWTYTAVANPPDGWPRIQEWDRTMVEKLEPYEHEHGATSL